MLIRTVNDNLQQQIKLLVTAWLVDYVPFGGEMPSDWHTISLSEIAENEGITRQGVRDAIKKAEAILTTAEKDLGYAKRFMEMAKELGVIRSHIEGLIENKENRDEGLKSLLSQVDALRSLSGVTDYGI